MPHASIIVPPDFKTFHQHWLFWTRSYGNRKNMAKGCCYIIMPKEMLWMVNAGHNICAKWFPLFVYAADFGSRLDVWASWEAYKKDIKILGTLHTRVYKTDLLLYNPWKWFRLLPDIFMYLQHFIISVKHTWLFAIAKHLLGNHVWANRFCWKLCSTHFPILSWFNQADHFLYTNYTCFVYHHWEAIMSEFYWKTLFEHSEFCLITSSTLFPKLSILNQTDEIV